MCVCVSRVKKKANSKSDVILPYSTRNEYNNIMIMAITRDSLCLYGFFSLPRYTTTVSFRVCGDKCNANNNADSLNFLDGDRSEYGSEWTDDGDGRKRERERTKWKLIRKRERIAYVRYILYYIKLRVCGPLF